MQQITPGNQQQLVHIIVCERLLMSCLFSYLFILRKRTHNLSALLWDIGGEQAGMGGGDHFLLHPLNICLFFVVCLRQGLPLSPRLEGSGAIMAHCCLSLQMAQAILPHQLSKYLDLQVHATMPG